MLSLQADAASIGGVAGSVMCWAWPRGAGASSDAHYSNDVHHAFPYPQRAPFTVACPSYKASTLAHSSHAA
eukprot:567003-Amphidinium_carterae.3